MTKQSQRAPWDGAVRCAGRRTRGPDREIDALIDAMASDDVQAVIRRTARFNWHRSVILAMLRQPGIKSLLVGALFP